MKLPSLSVFFPAYNERGNIERVINDALRILPSVAEEFEIIVVDDGSTDRTPDIVKDIMHINPGIVRLERHLCNMGYGVALTTGFSKARYEWVFFTDSDGQFDLSNLERFIQLTNRYKVILGFRRNRADNFIRKLNGYCWTQLVKLVVGIKVKDVDCAFKLINRSLVSSMNLHSKGAAISPELLANLKYSGSKWIEIPVNHYKRSSGRQTGANIGVIVKAFKELWVLRKALNSRLEYFLGEVIQK